MKYYIFFCLIILSGSAFAEKSLTAPEKFKLTLKPSDLKTVEQFESLMTQEYMDHLSRLFIVRLQDLLKVRRAIIDDGAVLSQKKLDEVIFYEMNLVMRKSKISKDQQSFIKDLKSEFDTYPLSINEYMRKTLKALYKKHKI